MKKQKKHNNRQVKIGILFVCVLVIGAIFGMVYNVGLQDTFQTMDDIINPPPTKQWYTVWEGSLEALMAEADPGNTSSWILGIYIHPHQTDIGGYLENSSANLEGNCTGSGLGFATADNTEVDIAHTTTWDFVVRVRGNDTHCKVGAVWFDTSLRIRWTSADLGVSADTELTLGAGEAKTTENNTNWPYLYMNFFDTNSGSGFSLTQDQTVEITSIKFEAYY